jgi:hypothetical protein
MGIVKQSYAFGDAMNEFAAKFWVFLSVGLILVGRFGIILIGIVAGKFLFELLLLVCLPTDLERLDLYWTTYPGDCWLILSFYWRADEGL